MQEEIVVKAPTTEALTPAQITQKAEDLGVTKTEMSFGRSFALSIMAGIHRHGRDVLLARGW